MLAARDFDCQGLLLFAYPLHPPGRPERIRDQHLYGIRVPMLFIQGSRDPFASPDLLEPVMDKLGKLATLTLGISFWAFVGLIICLTAALMSIDYRELWTRLEEAG